MPRAENISQLIERRMQGLSPRMQAAAAFVSANPIEVSCRSMRYIAEVTELPPPTFSRLARELGFGNYEEMKEACRRSARDTYSGYRDRAENLRALQADRESQTNFHIEYGMQAIRNIDETLLHTNGETLTRMAETLLDARHVFVNAQLGTGHLGAYMVYVASLAFDNWQMLGQETQSVAAQIRQLGPRDVVLSLGCQPYAQRTLHQMEYARKAGAQCLAITDTVSAPLFGRADTAVVAETAAPHFFASQVSMIYLVETLLGLMVAKSPNPIQDVLHITELFSEQIGEYAKGKTPN
ncbi:MAG: MurR/RpiR family transcriptional regulator [Candidatus Puniceispirillales bacterium]